MTRNRKPLESALIDRPWALSGVAISIGDVHDTDGRPLSERRACSDARRGVPFELKACPYRDERHGQPMNASALAPVLRRYEAVIDAVGALHRALPDAPPRWSTMLTAVMDRYAAPALHLLRARTLEGPIPGDLSAGHKLAAGYFGALQALLRQELIRPEGRRRPTTECFLQFVHDRRSLIGASEVCAGAPLHIEQLTDVLLCGQAGRDAGGRTDAAADPARVAIARALAGQVHAGIAFQIHDEVIEHRLLCDPHIAPRLRPRTAYLEDRLVRRRSELEHAPALHLGRLVGELPEDAIEQGLQDLLAVGDVELVTAQEQQTMLEVMTAGDAAIELADADSRASVARHLCALLAVYRATVRHHHRLEGTIRDALGLPREIGMLLNPLLIPVPRALKWLEIFCGHRLQCTVAEAPELALRNHHRRVPIAISRQAPQQP